MKLPDIDSDAFEAVMREAWASADQFAVAHPWGQRLRSTSGNAVLENLSRSVQEERLKFVVKRACELFAETQEDE